MKRMSYVLFAVALMAGSASAQYVVSAHSGVINKTEGQVLLDGKAVESSLTKFPEMKVDQTLTTEEGRAEVLLTPGAFLRLDENSSFRMINNKLVDTRVQVLSGSVLLEVAELMPQNGITLLYNDARVTILKTGVYRIDTEQSRFRVYEGEARVTAGDQTIIAKRGREVVLSTVIVASNFDPKVTDAFYRWSARRAENIAKANISSANTSRGSSGSSGCFTSNCGGSWSYNPWFGLYTYIPGIGTYCGGFGWCYYSPYSVYYLYYPQYGNYGGYNRGAGTAAYSNPRTATYDSSVGYNTVGRSGVSASMPSSSGITSSSSAAASGGSRGGGAASSSSGGSRGH